MKMLSRSLALILVAGLSAACTDTTTSVDLNPQFAKAGNGVVASATGSGVRSGSIRHFQFNAVQKADGSMSGQFNLTNEGKDNFSAHGEILCLRTDGNRAWVGHRITQSSFDPYVGTEGGFYVEDNGEGKGSDDQLSFTWVGGAPGLAQQTCDGLTSIEFTASSIDGGNIQVR
jgi:hypothetical protein